jgi:hypothetical protein
MGKQSQYTSNICAHIIALALSLVPPPQIMNMKKLGWKQVCICTLRDNRVGRKIHFSMNKSRRMTQSVTTHLVSSPTKGYQVHCLRRWNFSNPKGGNVHGWSSSLPLWIKRVFFLTSWAIKTHKFPKFPKLMSLVGSTWKEILWLSQTSQRIFVWLL